MPNWTSNTIRVEGHETDIRAFLEAVKWQDQIFDFNRIIPMPELLKHTGSGHATIEGKKVTSWYVVKAAADIGDIEETRLFTPEEDAALKDIGYDNWYDWSYANWGTKWNACRPEITEGCAAEGYIEIRFDTAWSSPLPVYHAMFEKFPQLSFTCSWQDEGEEVTWSIEREIAADAELQS